MTYSPECVAAFEAKFPPPDYIEFLRSGSIGGYVLKKGAKIDVDDKPLLDVFLQDRMLAAFAANWERVKELENLIVHASVHSAYPECGRDEMSSDERALFDEVLERNRKLLEKGNE